MNFVWNLKCDIYKWICQREGGYIEEMVTINSQWAIVDQDYPVTANCIWFKQAVVESSARPVSSNLDDGTCSEASFCSLLWKLDNRTDFSILQIYEFLVCFVCFFFLFWHPFHEFSFILSFYISECFCSKSSGDWTRTRKGEGMDIQTVSTEAYSSWNIARKICQEGEFFFFFFNVNFFLNLCVCVDNQ